ncbi:putative RNA-binding protein involved in heterochromatin assembly [Magnolia sinica]|uniref:putative RNA-binding protein involved in heterochromatin assembly n=1 Tax=Magnolia sinica TaxID=86752 RepID=UPI00265979DC|nr:putative RNA-binding protein involved in heterochromatin assembly [Magnolia sinica]
MSMKPGDWKCKSCQHLNFSRRDLCQRCSWPRPDHGNLGGRDGCGFNGPDVRVGDWYCLASNCGAHNFASRLNCFKCGALKDDSDGTYNAGYYGSTSGGHVWKSGDWMCTRNGCNEHNFASRMECYKCNAPRGSAT